MKNPYNDSNAIPVHGLHANGVVYGVFSGAAMGRWWVRTSEQKLGWTNAAGAFRTFADKAGALNALVRFFKKNGFDWREATCDEVHELRAS